MFLRFILIIAFLNNSVFAQPVVKSQSLPFPGIGPYSSNPDAFSFSANIAALSNYNENLIGVFSERKFLLEENSIHALYMGIPSKHGNFGFFLNYSGFSSYNQYHFGGAYAKSLGNVSAGIQFCYSKTKISDYINATNFSASLGFLFKINPKFYSGVQISNFIQSKSKGERELTFVRLGFGYQPSSSVFVGMDVSKEENTAGNVLLILRYDYNKRLHSGLSFNAGNITTSGSAGVSWSNYRVDISIGYHHYLGISPGITFYTKF